MTKPGVVIQLLDEKLCRCRTYPWKDWDVESVMALIEEVKQALGSREEAERVKAILLQAIPWWDSKYMGEWDIDKTVHEIVKACENESNS